MKLNAKILLRVCLFSLLTAVILLCLNSFFQPVWSKWNNYYTTKGFYEEPENTIETVFLGASVMQSSVSPMDMYNEHGINSYNLATEQQPVLGSYYWLKETYDYHSETLKNVVFDVSALRSNSKKAFYHKCFDNMKLSKNKIQGIYEYCNESITDTISFMVPLISYHNRWSTLEESDFTKYGWEKDTGTRGYYYIKNSYLRTEGLNAVQTPPLILDEKAQPSELLENSLEYLDRMVQFCKEKNLKLVFIKTSTIIWSSELHNAVQELADKYGIEFYDFNFEPLYSTNNFLHAFDSGSDGKHLNYYGAHKFTKWMGEYLTEKCGATDVRDNPKYDFMKDQYKEYEARVLQHVNLVSSKSLTEYLDLAFKGNNTVLLSVQENAAGALTEEDKKFFRENGLEKFAELPAYTSYVAVVQNGEVIYEQTGGMKSVGYKGLMPDGKTSYRLNSYAYDKESEGTAEIIVDKKPAMEPGRGLNILVYSNELGSTLNTTRFDTTVTTVRDNYGIHDIFFMTDEEEFNKDYAPETMRGKVKLYMEKIAGIKKAETERLLAESEK